MTKLYVNPAWTRPRPPSTPCAVLAAVGIGCIAMAAALSPVRAAPAAADFAGSTAKPTVRSLATCDPQVLTLPPLEGDQNAVVTAMNDGGLVAGYSGVTGSRALEAVVWPDGMAPISLGVRASAAPVDINDAGVIAVGSVNEPRRARAWLWEEGTLTRLPGPSHTGAIVNALNDAGVAVGAIARHGLRPVVWRDGLRSRLPVPHGARGEARVINNHGLVVGWIDPRGAAPTRLAWWRIGGRSGLLRLPHDLRFTPGSGLTVNDRGRIVAGGRPHAVKWRDRRTAPRYVQGTLRDFIAGHDSWSTGSGGGFRGIGSRAFVARLSDGVRRALPSPPNPDGWASTLGLAASHGVTAFAPQGGVTVGGFAQPGDPNTSPVPAVLWTCAQTYLP